ncbi:nanos homolog 2 [Ixodes scapularis]
MSWYPYEPLNEEIRRLLLSERPTSAPGFSASADVVPASPAEPRARAIRGRRTDSSTSGPQETVAPKNTSTHPKPVLAQSAGSRLHRREHARESDSAHSRRPPAAPVQAERRQLLECVFCKKNGETRSFARTHVLKDKLTGNVVCPILRKYKCELCGATGDNSHTRSYCPQRSDEVFNMALLKKTPRNSTDRRKDSK